MPLKIFIFLFLIFPFLSTAQEKLNFHKVKIDKGETIKSLIKKYQLDVEDCNLQKFYKLNKLTPTSKLDINKSYFIPVLLFDFNGKSIRSSIDIDDWQVAYRIDLYNKKMLDAGKRKKNIKDSKIIWVPYHELYCKEEIVVKQTSKRIFPIFGKKYEKIPLLDKKLAGKVYYIDAGHGGPDPGANAKLNGHRMCEDEYAYDISLRVARNLVEHGAIVYMVTRDINDGIRDEQLLKCDSDELSYEGEAIPINQKQRLNQRCNSVNRLYLKHKKQGVKSQRQIIIHVDSRNKKMQTDVFFYYKTGVKEGKTLAQSMQSTLEKKYKEAQPGRGYDGEVSSRDLYQLRFSKPLTVYVEIGNIRNSFDQQRFMYENNRQALANWLYEGFIK